MPKISWRSVLGIISFAGTSTRLGSGRKTRQRLHQVTEAQSLETRRVLSVTILDASLTEPDSGQAAMIFTLQRTGNLSQSLEVTYTTQDGTATSGVDYVAQTGSVFFGTGNSTATISVPILSDSFVEGTETFTVQLGAILETPADFSPAVSPVVNSGPASVAVADFNSDGKPDIVAGHAGTSLISILLNQTAANAESASFAAKQDVEVLSRPGAVSVGDFNGDGKPDIATANLYSNDTSVLLNVTTPGSDTITFLSPVTFSTGNSPFDLEVADMNGDGKQDIVSISNTDLVHVLLNTTTAGATTPTFAAAQSVVGAATPRSVTVADFNGDGRPDIAASGDGSTKAIVLLNNTAAASSTVSFQPALELTAGQLARSVITGDVNGDALPDLVVSSFNDFTVSVFANTTATNAATAVFSAPVVLTTTKRPMGILLADVTGDNRPDLVVTNQSDGGNFISVFRNSTPAATSTPSFAAALDFSTGLGPNDVKVGDFNSDSKTDLAVTNGNGSSVSILLNNFQEIIDSSAVGTIAAPALPTVTLSVSPATIAEASGVATLTATLSAPAPAGGVTIDLSYTGTATLSATPTDPADYTPSGTQIVIAAGATTGTVTVTAIEDTIMDPDETIVVDIASVTGGVETGTQQATITISEPVLPPLPVVTLNASPATISESGGVATFTATLSGPAPAGGVTVDLVFDGTATRVAAPTDPEDYTASGTQIVIAAGATTGTVTVTAIADSMTDPDETIVVDIANVTGATEDGVQQATVTISEPPIPVVTLSVSPATITENGGVATFTASLSSPAPAGGVTIDLGFGGTATFMDTPVDPADYTQSGTQIVIPAGASTGTVTVTATADVIVDPDETIIVDITSVTGATESGTQQATVTISEPVLPPLPLVTLAVSPATIAESGGVATFTATLSAPAPAGGATITLSFAGTATRVATPTDSADYTVSGTQIVIPAGTTTGTVTVTATADTITDPGETIVVDITSVTGATESGSQQATVTLTEPTALPTVTLSVSPASIAENGGVATFTATLSAPAPAGGVTVSLEFSGNATDPADYTRSGTQILIAAGATTGTVTATAKADTVADADETIIVDITGVTGASENGTQQATVTITEAAAQPTVAISVDQATITENGGVATFTATLSAPAPVGGVTVTLSFTGSASDPADYTKSAAQIMIAAGTTTGTMTVTAVADAVPDPDETVTVTIMGAPGATITGTPATITITEPPATIPGDMDGDGQVTTQDGNLVTLILLGASDSTLELLKTPGSTATAAQIKASFESNKVNLDVDNNGAAQSQDGNLIVLVKLGASDSILELLRGPANTPDTRNSAAQIKTFVQNLDAPPAAAFASTSGFAAASGSGAKVGVPVVDHVSDLFSAASTGELFIVVHPEEENPEQSQEELVETNPSPLPSKLLTAMEEPGDNADDDRDLIFEFLQDDNFLLQAL
ncbi:MAG: VCBS repeat-containing protein [Planctomycetaceae bacterium]|nr:VCBS repeat-containing protein [Planctomycetaceae bacterium]